jgi:hypothetical protein
MEKIKRYIHYYELIFTDKNKKEITPLGELFREIIKLNNAKDNQRFEKHYKGLVCTRDVKFEPEKKQIRGKFLTIRMDLFPELIDTIEDTITDINAKESEGVVETTHFVISYKSSPSILSLEYNHYGPRIADIVRYLYFIGHKLSIKFDLTPDPIVNDNLASFSRRIQRCSMFTARVHKDNIQRINEVDTELFSAFKTSEEFSDSEYVEIRVKIDFQKKAKTKKINDLIDRLIGKFLHKKECLDYFDSLKVLAEDADSNSKLELFDFLSNKIQSLVKVEKREKSRALISADIFEKIEKEFESLQLKLK